MSTINFQKPLLIVACLGLSTSLLTSCVPSIPPPPPMTQLQIREMQTREFDTRDYKLVMKAMLNVLQDEGFIVKNAVVDLGLLTATKELEVESFSSPSGFSGGSIFPGNSFNARRRGGFGTSFDWGAMLGNLGSPSDHRVYSKNSIIEVSANVSEYGHATRVRVNFQKKIVDNTGGTVEVHQITDPQFYQEFFNRVDKGIFIQKEKI